MTILGIHIYDLLALLFCIGLIAAVTYHGLKKAR